MIEQDKKISIIVPMYNVEQYADVCIASIAAQTYSNIEIILVDDGSEDTTPDICDEWGKRDKRVRVIHKANGGLSDARNAGLEIAIGEYIGFVDGDDWIHPQMYELLYKWSEKKGCNCACTGMRPFVAGEQFSLELQKIKTFIYGNEEFIRRTILGEDKFSYGVQFKLYTKELLHKVVFEKGVYYEDVNFFTEVCMRANNIVFVDVPLYFYRHRDTSITGGRLTEKHIRDYIHVWKREREILEKCGVSFNVDEYCWLELYRMKIHVFEDSGERKLLKMINAGIDQSNFHPWKWGRKRMVQYYLSRYAMWVLHLFRFIREKQMKNEKG